MVMTGVVVLAGSGWVVWSRSAAGEARAASTAPAVSTTAGVAPTGAADISRIVAPGRVEPVSEELEVAAEVSGRLESLRVEEGDRVEAGAVIATLERADYEARLATARAALAVAEAEEARLVNGARVEERREARFALEQADAALAQAEREHQRRVRAADVIPREELDRAASDVAIARARQAEARERARVVDAPARADERARARAAIQQARARVLEAEALLAKTTIRAPIAGTVLRVVRRAGESVSVEGPDGGHVVTIADVSVLRVRADVDERDVAHLATGQRAYVTADAYGDRRFTGRVIRISEMLGRKNLRSEEPTEKVDTKVLETLVELDPGQRLPVGLRVDTYILR
ncbi:secretion protein HlyD [Luteitalea sp. TBR-22]|nr:secretion protein HlyD [Luteitalea sp. TBR-22]